MASLGGGGLTAVSVTILGWQHIIKSNHIFTDFVICGEDLLLSSLGPKFNQFCGENFFFCFGLHSSHISGPKTFQFDEAMTFFFGCHLFLDWKGDTPQNLALGATIPSNASESATYIPRTVFGPRSQRSIHLKFLMWFPEVVSHATKSCSETTPTFGEALFFS